MTYKDVSADRWSAGAIERVSQTGIMSGFPDGTFRPAEPLTREQMASILDRLRFRDGLFADVLPAVLPSCVLVHRGDAFGSGVCIGSKGGYSYILTNAHVIGDKTSATLIKDNMPNNDAVLVHKDTGADLALLKTKAQFPMLEIDLNISLGEPVAVIGSPKGYSDSVTVGVISHLNRGNHVQTDAPINPGNSGGMVINERGKIVGIAVAKYVAVDTEGIAFFIKPEIIKNFVIGVLA
jgi:S1-C subfamily serine protease